jgi:hypothetical protein
MHGPETLSSETALRHLSYCAGCSTYVDQIRETIRQTGIVPREESLPPVAERDRCSVPKLEARLGRAGCVALGQRLLVRLSESLKPRC